MTLTELWRDAGEGGGRRGGMACLPLVSEGTINVLSVITRRALAELLRTCKTDVVLQSSL